MDVDSAPLEGVMRLLGAAGRLKRIRRTGWVESGVPDAESVADHSFRTAILAMALADLRGLDTLKALRMALLHDLAESSTGDLTPRQKEASPGWEAEEQTALEETLGGLPPELTRLYLSVWSEFREQRTEEARLVHDADKLEMLQQSIEYAAEGGDAAKLMRFRHVSAEGEIEKKLGKKMRESG